MSFLAKFLPVILISVIVYLFLYNIYPQYQESLTLLKKIDELKNNERIVDLTKNLLENLNQSDQIKDLLSNRDLLNSWLPLASNIDEILLIFDGILKSSKINYKDLSFQISDSRENVVLNQNVLPLLTVTISLGGKFNPEQIKDLIEKIENNIRLMEISNFSIDKNNQIRLEVKSYYLNLNNI